LNSQEIKGRPHSVAALLFEAYEIDAEPTTRNIELAKRNKSFGKSFRADFGQAVAALNNEQTNFAGFEALGVNAANAVKTIREREKQKRPFNLDNALNTVEKLSNTAGRVIGNIKARTFTEDQQKSERILGINTTLFLVIAGLACFLFLISMKKS
jgi:hypothetical protein